MKQLFTLLFALGLLVGGTITANAQKKEEPKYYGLDYQSHEVSVSYGYGSAIKWVGGFGGILSNTSYGERNQWGAVSLSYLYRPYDKITFGGSYAFTGFQSDLLDEKGNVVGKGRGNLHVIMPVFKSNWFVSEYVTLYSRAGIGVAIGIIDLSMSNGETGRYTEAEFAFQASPIGVEVGKDFSFFAEGGFGYQGLLILGFRYKF